MSIAVSQLSGASRIYLGPAERANHESVNRRAVGRRRAEEHDEREQAQRDEHFRQDDDQRGSLSAVAEEVKQRYGGHDSPFLAPVSAECRSAERSPIDNSNLGSTAYRLLNVQFIAAYRVVWTNANYEVHFRLSTVRFGIG